MKKNRLLSRRARRALVVIFFFGVVLRIKGSSLGLSVLAGPCFVALRNCVAPVNYHTKCSVQQSVVVLIQVVLYLFAMSRHIIFVASLHFFLS